MLTYSSAFGVSVGGDPVLSFAEIFGVRKLRVPGLSCDVVCVILYVFFTFTFYTHQVIILYIIY